MAAPSFRREPRMRHRGIGREASIELSPTSLVKAFGEPTDESWDTESLGGYYFVSPDDRPFTVYYRAYDQPSVAIKRLRQRFWSESTAYEFSIGALAKEGTAEFIAWLQSQVAG